jgi:hypothetical protein
MFFFLAQIIFFQWLAGACGPLGSCWKLRSGSQMAVNMVHRWDVPGLLKMVHYIITMVDNSPIWMIDSG